MKEEKSLDEQLRDMKKIRKDDPEVLRKKIEELEDKVQELEHENTSSESRLNITSSGEEIYNGLIDAYENTQINKELYSEEFPKAINKYKGKLEKELLSTDNINEEIIQRISNYINKKQIFNEFSPTDSAKAGVFLTKLIEISPSTEITLKLERGSDIDCLGYGFAGKKKIIVEGDLGDRIGYFMKAGILEINGNVFGRCGANMTSGSIEIKEDVRGDIGSSMEGGKIIVHGDVNKDCGCHIMKGGLIEIDGNVKGYVAAGMLNGKIHIEGDVNDHCGYHMIDGFIEINGNAYGSVAENMQDGKIHIEGDVDGSIGENIEGGKIVVHGEVNKPCGAFMKGGLIEIYGDVNNYVAQEMEGGIIRIHSDQKFKIHTKKKYWSGDIVLSKTGGSVYHKDKLF